MPKLWNLDHQPAVIADGVSVAPGEPYEFTAAQVKAGVAGSWSEKDPREGLKAEREFKQRRDAKAAKSPKPSPDEAADAAQTNPPAESGENKE